MIIQIPRNTEIDAAETLARKASCADTNEYESSRRGASRGQSNLGTASVDEFGLHDPDAEEGGGICKTQPRLMFSFWLKSLQRHDAKEGLGSCRISRRPAYCMWKTNR